VFGRDKRQDRVQDGCCCHLLRAGSSSLPSGSLLHIALTLAPHCPKPDLWGLIGELCAIRSAPFRFALLCFRRS